MEQELHSLLVKIKELKRAIRKINIQRLKVEREYNLKYAYNDWKTKEGKCFEVTGKDNALFYCKVISATQEEKTFEYIDPVEEIYATDTITDPKKDCGYKRWIEITGKKYNKKKEGKREAELE